ncbi:MAG: KpsF/GutQ family sugar-phosphate isomerase [Planctomycetes bacterium]|nr:KpsF/GutQ family sugar-phosphate isomerase [Planctomycetota bacterium]
MSQQTDLDVARRTLKAEGEAVISLADQVDERFASAATALFECKGKVVMTGVGKAGIIARKISATLASTGTQSIFMHPVEALHGDLGRVCKGDIVIVLSHSGSSEEIVRLLDHLKSMAVTIIAFTGNSDSILGRHADITVCYGKKQEACPHGLAPTVSTCCMLALGDALALTVMQMRRFQPEDFAAFHPGGDLGRRLLKVEQAMTFKKDEQLKVVRDDLTLAQALVEAESVPRRSGAMVLVDSHGRLSGILTDGDVRRLLISTGGRGLMDRPVKDVMKQNPLHISIGELASKALGILNSHRIDELPVVDEEGKPVGIIDVQDLLGVKTIREGR